MAVIGVKEKTSLKLELDAGLVDGRQRIQTKSFNRVKPEADDENIYETALVLGGLQKKEIMKVKKLEESILSEG